MSFPVRHTLIVRTRCFLIQDPQLFLRRHRHRPAEKRRCVAVLIGFSRDIAANLPTTRTIPPAPYLYSAISYRRMEKPSILLPPPLISPESTRVEDTALRPPPPAINLLVTVTNGFSSRSNEETASPLSIGTFECHRVEQKTEFSGKDGNGRREDLPFTRFSPAPIVSRCFEREREGEKLSKRCLSFFPSSLSFCFSLWNDTCNYITFRRVIFSRSTFD